MPKNLARSKNIGASSGVDVALGAILAGSILAGAMIGLNLMAVPALLEGANTPAELFRQWAALYRRGVRTMPPLGVATALLYALAIAGRRASGRPWGRFAAAALATVAMIPFTLLVMAPTNDNLFRLEEAASRTTFGDGDGDGDGDVTSMSEARDLVAAWARLHLTRSMFPLAGAVIGTLAVLG